MLGFFIFFTALAVFLLWAFDQGSKDKRVTERKLILTAETFLKDSQANALVNEFARLSTFGDVAVWDIRAETAIQKIVNGIQLVEKELNAQSKHLGGMRVHTFRISHLAMLENMAEKLRECIDFTPNSPTEQKTLLKELRHQKKELQFLKRELSANMKTIRDSARVQSVHAGKVLWTYNSKVAARERRQIRYKKEAALRPNEDVKAAIERQILQIDRDILWVERFTA